MIIYLVTKSGTVEFGPDVDIFSAVNTHGGDVKTNELILQNTNKNTIRDLMFEMLIIDKGIEHKLIRDNNFDSFVSFLRTGTNKTIKFKVEIDNGDNKFIELKPDANGLFYVKKKWLANESIKLKLTIEVEAGFSEKFGEVSSLELRTVWYGEVDEDKKATLE